MSKKSAGTRRIRTAVLAAGLGAAMVCGAGAAFADEAPTTLTDTAGLIEAQATAQAAVAAGKATGWEAPVTSYTLSATFGKGGSLWSHKHSGQDFAVPLGTKVHAVHAGVVVKAGPNGAGDGPAYGNAIVIKHADKTYSQYAHLSKIQVKVGQSVSEDQLIGLSGNTGNSTGPHLHFEIRTTPNYGSAIDPVSFLRLAGVTL
ncbi:M23 family metallopeptidase [Streptomyces sp. NBC_00536]|uniref:M23 family metallopeptidase n=1 Tax=Streptomyces sp. NBC_00536 TaxID=2975769 RepID=UPI002E80532A|nr:M23 family metallopeptidase [Streptomyces sp. NBC_00536]WUC79755.1 M23 family metallopeptidase [Streptomyces sp. NBC_00536]